MIILSTLSVRLAQIGGWKGNPMMIQLRKLRIWFKRLFEPWQDLDLVRAEVQAARRNVPCLAWKPNPDQPTRRVGETQLEWQARRDG